MDGPLPLYNLSLKFIKTLLTLFCRWERKSIVSRKSEKSEMRENMGFSTDEISSNFGPVPCLVEKNGNQIDYESPLEILLESHENKNVLSSYENVSMVEGERQTMTNNIKKTSSDDHVSSNAHPSPSQSPIAIHDIQIEVNDIDKFSRNNDFSTIDQKDSIEYDNKKPDSQTGTNTIQRSSNDQQVTIDDYPSLPPNPPQGSIDKHETHIEVNKIHMSSNHEDISNNDQKSSVKCESKKQNCRTGTNNIKKSSSDEHNSIDDHPSPPQSPIDSHDSQIDVNEIDMSLSQEDVSKIEQEISKEQNMQAMKNDNKKSSSDEHDSINDLPSSPEIPKDSHDNHIEVNEIDMSLNQEDVSKIDQESSKEHEKQNSQAGKTNIKNSSSDEHDPLDDEPSPPQSPIDSHKTQIDVNEIDLTSNQGVSSIDQKSPVEYDIEWKDSQTVTNDISTEHGSIEDHQNLPQIPVDSQDSLTKMISLEKSSSHEYLSYINHSSPVQSHMEIHISQAEMKSKDEYQSLHQSLEDLRKCQIEMFKTDNSSMIGSSGNQCFDCGKCQRKCVNDQFSSIASRKFLIGLALFLCISCPIIIGCTIQNLTRPKKLLLKTYNGSIGEV